MLRILRPHGNRPALARPLASALAAAALLACFAPRAHAQFFNAVFSRDGRDVIAVGDSGQVYRSLDGGATWSNTYVGGRALRDVAARGFSIVIVGDSGKVWRSTDSGGGWALRVLPGTPDLRSLAWPTSDTLFATGAGGAMFRSTDGGATWSAQTSGVATRLNAIRFRDQLNGWAVGDGGVALHTSNGGALWSSAPTPTTANLLAVDWIGSTVWAAGEKGVALKSVTSGASWSPQNLKLDHASDVRAVWVESADSVYLGGGGGFIRRSVNGGASWTFQTHPMEGQLTCLRFAGGAGWAVNRSTRLVLRTTSAGDTWSVPAGLVQKRTWPLMFGTPGTVRGNTFALNPSDHKTLYVMLGPSLYRSPDDGTTWNLVSTVTGATTVKTNAFVVSPKDTNLMLAAIGTPDRIVRSIDGGKNWTTVFTKDFGEYGVPLEMHPDRPDTVYFAPDGDKVQISTNFGQSWSPLSTMSFSSPCDLVAVPGSDSGVMVLGDGITGSTTVPGKLYRSNDGGVNWSLVYTAPPSTSEIPGVASSRLGNTSVFASGWGGLSFKRSLDSGLSWSTSLLIDRSWGIDVANDDPNLVIFGSYGTTFSYFSFDGGANWLGVSPISGANYGFLAVDRALILAQQSTGICRLAVNDTFPLLTAQSVAVATPNGGEAWVAGSQHDITWSSSNVTLAKIEYRRTVADSWQTLAIVDGAGGRWTWTVPRDSTADASIRVSDAWDASPLDEANAPFAILVPHLVASRAAWDFGGLVPGDVADYPLTIANVGTGALTVSLVSSSSPYFWAGRTSMSLAPGSSDTLGLHYSPAFAQIDAGVVTLISNGAAAPDTIQLAGHGVGTAAVGETAPLSFALWPARPNPFTARTQIRYALPERARVTLEVYDLQGHRVARLVDGEQGAGTYSVPFGAGAAGGRAALPSGVYFVRFDAGRFRATQKLLMLR